MDYQAMYQQKLTTPEEAVKVVKSGDWVDYTWCTNHPVALDKALAARKDELTDVKIRGGVTMWMPEIAKADDAGDHFTWHSWHCSGIPMDAHGNFNFGLAASHLADMMARAKCIIVEVNQNMPWVYGLTGTEINIQDVAYVVEGDNPPVAQLGAGGEPTDVDRAVANPPWPSWAPAASPPTWTVRWPIWWSPRSPTGPACSWVSAACPTPSGP